MISATLCWRVGSLNRPPWRPTASWLAEQRTLKRTVPADPPALGVVLGLAEAADVVGWVDGPFGPAIDWHAASTNGTPTTATRCQVFTSTQTGAALNSYRLAGRRLCERVAQPGGVVGEQPLEEQNQPPYK